MSRPAAGMALASLASGCINLTVQPLPPSAGVDDCVGCAPNDLEGTVFAFVNGKLTDAATAYSTNVILEDDASVLGATVLLYDPQRPGHVVKLGNVDLGPDHLGDGAKARQTFKDLAWHPDLGLWALTLDYVNDEWILTHIDVPDWQASDQRLPATSYAFRTTDPIYWEPAVSGLAFVGDQLVLGTQADAAGPGGRLFTSDVPDAWGVEPAYPDDPEFYADRVLSELTTAFPDGLGVAGDLADGDQALATVRSESTDAGDLEINWLWQALPEPLDLGLDVSVIRNQDLEGIAVLDDPDTAWAIDTEATIFRFDLADGAAGKVDDLSAVFTDPVDGIRIRGAARVTIP